MRIANTSTALALLMTLGAGSAFAAAEWTFSDIDQDGNLELSNKEFEQVSQDAFRSWDTNQDQRLTSDELDGGIYASWDRDRDDRLSESEFDSGWLGWFGDDDQVAYSDLDRNGDAYLDEDEFTAGLQQSAALDDWSVGDEGVDWQNFHTALYGVYDTDRNAMVNQDEYGAYSDTYMMGDMAQAGVGAEETAAVGETITPQEVISMSDWRSEDLYLGGMSVDEMMDDMEVYGPTGEEIGSVENVVFSNDGRVLSLVAEVGGFWDMFDTHVNVPWDQVNYSGEDKIIIPVTEENVEDYSTWKTGYLTPQDAMGVEVVDDDLETSPGIFRATDLMGDYARVKGGEANGYSNYGYVNDLIIRDGQLQAVVVSPDAGYGISGPYAYPYYSRGWSAGRPYYDMPYDRADVVDNEPLDYDRFGVQ